VSLYGGLAEMQLRQTGAERYAALARWPICQPEAIANHYLSHLAIAKQLDKAIKMARHGEGFVACNELIEYEIALIKTNHLCDLGIALEWPRKGDEP